MANQPLPNTGIKKSWALMAFAKSHGKPSLASCSKVDEETGEVESWKSVAFTHPTEVNPETGKPKVVFVSFSSKLNGGQPLTAKEIAEQKDDLQVVQREGSESFILCKKGQNSWEDIDLGI